MKAFIQLCLALGLSASLFSQEEVKIDFYPPSHVPDRIMLTWETEPHNSQAVPGVLLRLFRKPMHKSGLQRPLLI